MNREKLKKMISMIDDEKLAEAAVSPEQQGVHPATRSMVSPVWQKAIMAAAVVLFFISAVFVWTRLRPGLNPTETMITTVNETTTAATMVAPKWEEREVFEKYIGGAVISGIEYQSSVRELDENLIEAKLGDLKLTGYDIYTDKTYEISATFYRIQHIDPDCVVAVRYEGYDGCYGFFNSTFKFKTLADLINRLDLPEHLKINNAFTHSVWYGDINKELLRWDTYSLPDPGIVWKQLLARTDSINEGEAARDKLGWEVMSISIDYAPAGQSKIGIVLFDNGYLTTNILWSLQSFYIGEEAVMAFRDFVLTKGTFEKRIGLDSPVETTIPAEGEMSTRESAAQTTQANSRSFVHAEGYFLETDENYFFVTDGDSSMFSDKEFIKIFPGDETITFDGLNSGDRIGIKIETVGDLYPRVMDIHQIELIETGDISNIDEVVITKLIGLGFHVKE